MNRRPRFSDPTPKPREAIHGLDGQLYAVIGRQDADGRWQVRLWWKPFVTLIWLGGVLIALGGLLALIGRQWRQRGVRRRQREAEEWA